jgi:hypothetical protein
MMKLAKIQFGDDMIFTHVLVSFYDGWDCEAFLDSIKHLLLETAVIDTYDREAYSIKGQELDTVLNRPGLLCIATQLKDEQEIESLKEMIDSAEKNKVFFTTVLLCDVESRSDRQEKALEYFNVHANAVIDLQKMIPSYKKGDAVSFIVQSILAACVFPDTVPVLDIVDVKDSVRGIAHAAIVRETDHNDYPNVSKFAQATVEQMSRQQKDLSRANSIYVAAFGNHETLTMQFLVEFVMDISVGEDAQCIMTGVYDDTMKDGEILVVTIAS